MSRRLLLLNGLAILNVILFHAVGWGFTAMFAWPHRYLPVTSPNYDQAGTVTYYGLRVIEQWVAFSIAAFIFISGFFVAFSTERHRPTVTWTVIRSRIRSLGVPYLFWSIVVWLGFALQGRVFSAGGYVRLLLTGATNPAYYFVPLLIQLYLVSPFIVPWARTQAKWLLIVTGLIQLLVYVLPYALVLEWNSPVFKLLSLALPKWFFPVRLFWFSFGMVVGFHWPRIKPILERLKKVLLGIVVTAFVAGIFEWELLLRLAGRPWAEHQETLIDGLYAGAFILGFLIFTELALPFSNQLSSLGSKSFGIYLVHSPVMEVVARGLYHLAPAVLGYQILLQPLLMIFGLGIPLVLMYFVRKSPAKTGYAYLFG